MITFGDSPHFPSLEIEKNDKRNKLLKSFESMNINETGKNNEPQLRDEKKRKISSKKSFFGRKKVKKKEKVLKDEKKKKEKNQAQKTQIYRLY